MDQLHLPTPQKFSYDNVQHSESKYGASPSDDESDSDEDENQRRKYISLNAGQHFSCVWPLANQGNIDNFVCEKEKLSPLKMFCDHNNQVLAQQGPLRRSLRHVRNSSSPSKFFYDSIRLNNDFEYGFNPLRARGSKSGNVVRLRPLSLYTPPPSHLQSFMATSLTRGSVNLALWSPFHLKPTQVRSFAKTDVETKLEKEILMLRSQSNNINLHNYSNFAVNKQEIEDDIAYARRRHFFRRQLSFGGRTRSNWRKTLSLDSGLAAEVCFGKSGEFSKDPIESSRSEETLDKLISIVGQAPRQLVRSNECTVSVTDGVVTEGHTNASEILSDEVFAEPEHHSVLKSVGSVLASDYQCSCTYGSKTQVECESLKVAIHHQKEAPSDNKAVEKVKRRASIPHILSAFKLPNGKTFRKLIKRKVPDASLSSKDPLVNFKTVVLPASISFDGTSTCTAPLQNVKAVLEAASEHVVSKLVICNDSAAPAHMIQEANELEECKERQKISLFGSCSSDIRPVAEISTKPARGRPNVCENDISTAYVVSKTSELEALEAHDEKRLESLSGYSLPRVDEDTEVHEFTRSVERKSRSSCNIANAKASRLEQRCEFSALERRMSDTALSWKCEKTSGRSPGKRFVRRILSPVVCGAPSPDKYGIRRNDSLQSLVSCDSGSITSDMDSSFHLFDFSSQELAEEMAVIDKELLVRISWDELALCGWMSVDKYVLASNVMKMVEFFNRIAMLVASTILAEETAFRRARVIRKSIKLAVQCRRICNFNSLKAVLGGLQCTPIFRLKSTWRQVPSKYRRIFRELSEFMSEDHNFLLYRRALRDAMLDPPCLPFLGNFLTQVAHAEAYLTVASRPRLQLNGGIANSDSDKKPELGMSKQLTECRADESDRPVDDGDSSARPPPDTSELTVPGVTRTGEVRSTHSRNNSDDSGVVLRLSRTFDDFEASPRESGVSSPDDEGQTFEAGLLTSHRPDDVYCGRSGAKSPCNESLRSETVVKFNAEGSLCRAANSVKNRLDSRKTVGTGSVNPDLPCRTSLSVDERVQYRAKADIRNVWNNRLMELDRENSGEYENELTFWKYQIAAVQYRFVPRPYIRRFLLGWPFNTEEDNYRLSLKREPHVNR